MLARPVSSPILFLTRFLRMTSLELMGFVMSCVPLVCFLHSMTIGEIYFSLNSFLEANLLEKYVIHVHVHVPALHTPPKLAGCKIHLSVEL